ncbi:MAG: hypothetical protein EBT92_12975 [Planctomycetes bacterium]|nr:hypothetical protein [Planctomycetota bacterium]
MTKTSPNLTNRCKTVQEDILGVIAKANIFDTFSFCQQFTQVFERLMALPQIGILVEVLFRLSEISGIGENLFLPVRDQLWC